MTADLDLSDLPLGGVRASDHVHEETNDNTCSRCREVIGEDEVPLMLWPASDRTKLLIFCQRCAYDPYSDRCVACGCSHHSPCEPPCSWYLGGLCSACAPLVETPEIVERLSARASREVPT